jgi:uncharacterized membrane protein
MNQTERYISEVLANVIGPAENRQRLAADLRVHFEDGRAVGDTDAVLIQRMGSPEEVAASFREQVELPYASFGIRVFAQLTDFAVMAFAIAPVWVVLAVVEMSDTRFFGILLFGLVWSWTVLVSYPNLA